MKKSRWFLTGILGIVLVFGLALTGCPTESDDGDGGFPPINEPTTGRETVKYTDAAISGAPEGLTADATAIDADMGITQFTISGGKLTLKLETPTSLTTTIASYVSSGGYLAGKYLYDVNGDNAVTVSSTDVEAVVISKFPCTAGGDPYELQRKWEDTDGKTYRYSKEIFYVYVDGNVTLTRDERKITEGEYDITSHAFDLQLKNGWNLLQFDESFNVIAEGVYVAIGTLKIADTDLSCTVEKVKEDD
ncbi:MAG: hypothetical protein LBR93_00360 [Treponema sp.]|jgi:hypothetical protein|nr:hypothetical protein [Treponema sp.]